MNVERDLPGISVIVIGRNEGARLTRCLESVRAADYPEELIELIYVDTASTDDSCARAAALGAKVVRIAPDRPSAAAARNAGLAESRREFVHFLDGDTVLDRTWLKSAVAVMDDPAVAIVYGRRDEIDPGRNFYHFCMHHDWYVPPGRVESCGGDILARRVVLERAQGYDAGLIAGEERDLCCRLIRDQGVTIVRLDEPMTRHDINMTHFRQYWRRCVRAGYAYAQVGTRYPSLRAWRRTCRRNFIHVGAGLTAVGLSIALVSPWPFVVWLALVAVSVTRDAWRCRAQCGSFGGALIYALHHFVAKAPTVVGHLQYFRRHVWGGPPQPLIEYQAPRREALNEARR